jgi:hypothetical protein
MGTILRVRAVSFPGQNTARYGSVYPGGIRSSAVSSGRYAPNWAVSIPCYILTRQCPVLSLIYLAVSSPSYVLSNTVLSELFSSWAVYCPSHLGLAASCLIYVLTRKVLSESPFIRQCPVTKYSLAGQYSIPPMC